MYRFEAIETIHRAIIPEGIMASSEYKDNYRAIWSRDSMMTGIVGFLQGDELIIDAYKSSINTLALYQGISGQIPSNVSFIKDEVKLSYGSTVGRIDATTWWTIGACFYLSKVENLEMKQRLKTNVTRALEILDAWEINTKGLIYTPLGGNWADEYFMSGYTLYDNALRYWALKLAAKVYQEENWIEKAEILAVGCSNTWGYGVPVDGRWTNILGERINKEIRNLSFPGGSINDLVAKSFEYFKIFGNPEIMLCLFPDPFRLRLPIKKNITKEFTLNKEDSKNNPPDLTFGDIQLDVHLEISQRNKYIKRPYTYREILPSEVPLFFSMQAIHLLEQYCRSNNIKLIWSSWHPQTVMALNNDKENIFSNVVFNKDLVIDYHLNNINKLENKEFDEDCHKEYENYFKECFHIGGDVEDGLENAHPGVHKQIHIAEGFYQEMNK